MKKMKDPQIIEKKKRAKNPQISIHDFYQNWFD